MLYALLEWFIAAGQPIILQVFAIEFGNFAIEFVLFAIEFVAFAIELVPFAVNKNGSWRKHDVAVATRTCSSTTVVNNFL